MYLLKYDILECRKQLKIEREKKEELKQDKEAQCKQYQADKKQYDKDKSELLTKIRKVEAERECKDETIKTQKEKAQTLQKNNNELEVKLNQKNEENIKLKSTVKEMEHAFKNKETEFKKNEKEFMDKIMAMQKNICLHQKLEKIQMNVIH